MAEVVDLATVRVQRQRQAQEIEQRRLEEAARLVLAAIELAGPAPTSRIATALLRRF